MPNVGRFRHADPRRVRPFAVDSATVIEVGDAVFQAVDDVRPAASFTYVTGSLPQTQANFRRDFMGVALTGSAAGETRPVSVAQRGVFEFLCPAAAYEIGDRVGMEDNAGATALLNQTVIALGENGGHGEIGKVVKRYGTNTTSVQVEVDVEMLRGHTGQVINLFSGSTTTASDLVNDWVVQYPFKLVAVHAIVIVAYTGTDVLTVRRNNLALDDTVSVTGAVGVVVRTVMDDANGRDIFNAGDLLDIATDGASTSGTAAIMIEVIPFLHES
jgi:hypothetical protein